MQEWQEEKIFKLNNTKAGLFIFLPIFDTLPV